MDMAAHPNAVPYSGYSCLVCAAKFSSRVQLVAHWNAFAHAPASIQQYAVTTARQVLTGETIDRKLVPVEDRIG